MSEHVELIREAARLIRQRAEAATPGPWTAENEYRMLNGCRCLSCYEAEPYAKAIHDIDAQGEDCSPILKPADAEHIASWHPGVALLVADLLDEALLYAELLTWRQYPMAVKGVTLARAIVGKL